MRPMRQDNRQVDSDPRMDLNQPPIDPDDEAPASLVREFVWFIGENKKWWLIPLVVMFLLLGLLIFLGTNPLTAPLIYPFL